MLAVELMTPRPFDGFNYGMYKMVDLMATWCIFRGNPPPFPTLLSPFSTQISVVFCVKLVTPCGLQVVVAIFVCPLTKSNENVKCL